MKLSKLQRKQHGEAESLLSLGRTLKEDERMFVLDHWLPGATGDPGIHGVFFTPRSIAESISYYPSEGPVIDACAGIGRLAFHCWLASKWSNHPKFTLTCVEFNSNYVEVGRRVLPEAEWIRADLTDYAASLDGKRPFREAISNPPYGKVPTLREWRGYTGPAHLVAAAVLGDITRYGGWMIVPEADIAQSFRSQGRVVEDSSFYQKFRAARPDLSLSHYSHDFSQYRSEWMGASPNVTLADLDIREIADSEPEDADKPEEPASIATFTQPLLFAV